LKIAKFIAWINIINNR